MGFPKGKVEFYKVTQTLLYLVTCSGIKGVLILSMFDILFKLLQAQHQMLPPQYP
jgi:hypothetical protein